MPGSRPALFALLIALSVASGSAVDASHRVQPYVESSVAVADTDVRPLPFLYDLYTFRGGRGRTTIVAAFAVAAGELESERLSSSARYRFEVTLVLADTVRRSVSRTADSVYAEFTDELPEHHLMYTHIEVLAPPSTTTWQRVIMTDATTPGVGQLYTDYFPIPDYSGDELMLSDIALGQPDASAGWERGDVMLALLPTARFPTSAFDVYYEIYNLPAGHQYTTEIVIERADSTDRRPIRLGFTGQSAALSDDMQAELRRVETSLPRGSYVITVNITDRSDGRTATRSRAFQVHRWERGATMVAAMPHRGARSADR